MTNVTNMFKLDLMRSSHVTRINLRERQGVALEWKSRLSEFFSFEFHLFSNSGFQLGWLIFDEHMFTRRGVRNEFSQ